MLYLFYFFLEAIVTIPEEIFYRLSVRFYPSRFALKVANFLNSVSLRLYLCGRHLWI